VIIHKLLHGLAESLKDEMPASGEAILAFTEACRQADNDPRERQRIGDIADLLEAEETLYAQARAAADRGDTNTAVPLLRQCAEAGTGEAAWLLAQLLEDTGDIPGAMAWYQRARDDGDPRAAEKLAALRLRPCPLADLAGSPREHRTAAPDRTTPAILVSHTYDLWTNRALLSAAAGPADQAADVSGSYPELLDWLVLKAPHHGTAPGGKQLNASVLPVVFSCPDCDHLASVADVWRAVGEARNYLVHDTSWVKARLAMKLTKMLRAREPALAAEWTLPGLLVLWAGPGGPGKSQAAAEWALRWRLDYEDYDRPCPANLGRHLAAAGRWHPRWPGREPTVADVMLPPSEVPECKPDTTVAQALELLVQSGTQALPVCQMTRVTGIVTLADLARHISDHQGVPPVTETVRALMRPATIVPPGTPLPAIAKAIADDGIIAVAGSGDQPDGYLTAESLLTQAPPGTSARPAVPDRPPLLIPGSGAVLLNRGR